MVDALVKGYGGEIREPKVGRADSNQRPREQMVLITQRAKVELWVKSKSQDFWGPRI